MSSRKSWTRVLSDLAFMVCLGDETAHGADPGPARVDPVHQARRTPREALGTQRRRQGKSKARVRRPLFKSGQAGAVRRAHHGA
jgi:hypothetical protein